MVPVCLSVSLLKVTKVKGESNLLFKKNPSYIGITCQIVESKEKLLNLANYPCLIFLFPLSPSSLSSPLSSFPSSPFPLFPLSPSSPFPRLPPFPVFPLSPSPPLQEYNAGTASPPASTIRTTAPKVFGEQNKNCKRKRKRRGQ